MEDEINRFWVPVASILPVFMLALVIEARLAFSVRSKKQRKRAEKEHVAFRVLDDIGAIAYAGTFVGAMALLLIAFFLALARLAGLADGSADAAESARASVFLIVLIGVIFTALLPMARILDDLMTDRLEAPMRAAAKRILARIRWRNPGETSR